MPYNIPALYNTEIESFLSAYSLPHFLGVFSSNNIPRNLPKTCVFICNLSNDYQIGTHFITIAKVDTQLFVLDSLALNMASDTLLKKLAHISNTYTHLKSPIQSGTSQACGLFCIFFVLLFHSASHCSLIKFNTTHLQCNDNICIQNIKTLLRNI